MASNVREKQADEKPMASNVVATAAGEPEDEDRGPVRQQPPELPPPSRSDRAPGFFTIYKSGQGYWTRMGTAIAAALLGLLITTQLYRYVPVLLSLEGRNATRIAIGVAAAFAIGYTVLAWYLINKPSHVDFLISTDSEMKKVNWTSRKELIGSTKVVIVFMLLIAVFLFSCDLIFHTIFWLIGVLKVKPPFLGGH